MDTPVLVDKENYCSEDLGSVMADRDGERESQRNPGSNMSYNSRCTVTYLPSLKPSKSDKQDMRYTAREVRTNS